MHPALKTLAPNPFEFSARKLEAAILFFLERANNGHLGRTKLMKLLYYADFDHMEQYGAPITGATYRKLEQGPVPTEAFELLERMAQGEDKKIESEKRETGPYKQFRYQPLIKPNLSFFSDTELRVLHQVADRWESTPLSQIVAATHTEAPWLSVRMGTDIPYELAHYRRSLNANW